MCGAEAFRSLANFCDRVLVPRAGDVVLFHQKEHRKHLGIYTTNGIVHADNNVGEVRITPVDLVRVSGFYKFKDLDG